MRGATVKLLRKTQIFRTLRQEKRWWHGMTDKERARKRALARRDGLFKDGKDRRPYRRQANLPEHTHYRAAARYFLRSEMGLDDEAHLRRLVASLGPNWKAESEVVDDIEEVIP